MTPKGGKKIAWEMSQACTDNKIIVQATHTKLKCTSFQYEAFRPCLYTPMANPSILFIIPFIISSCLDNNWKFAKMDKISSLVLTSIIQMKAIHNSQLNCKNLKREYGHHSYEALYFVPLTWGIISSSLECRRSLFLFLFSQEKSSSLGLLPSLLSGQGGK